MVVRMSAAAAIVLRCESCRRRVATRLAIIAGAEFFVCAPCDIGALERERRHVIPNPVIPNPDNPTATAARRATLAAS
jgi:hypothetical protein